MLSFNLIWVVVFDLAQNRSNAFFGRPPEDPPGPECMDGDSTLLRAYLAGFLQLVAVVARQRGLAAPLLSAPEKCSEEDDTQHRRPWVKVALAVFSWWTKFQAFAAASYCATPSTM